MLMPSAALRQRFTIPAAIALAVAVFALDAAVPEARAAGVAHVLVVLLALAGAATRQVLQIAALCSVLALIAPMFAGSALSPWSAVEAMLAIVAIWSSALLGIRRNRAHSRLLESEGQFHALAESVPLMVWRARADGSWDFVSNGWSRFTGRDFGLAAHETWQACLHPADREEVWRKYRDALEAGHAFQLECRLRRGDGSYRWCIMYGEPRTDERGGFTGFVGSCVDISDRKLTEERLRNSEAHCRAIANSVPTGLLTFDASGSIDSINLTARELFGLEREVPHKLCLCNLIPEEQHADEQGRPSSVASGIREVEGRRLDGSLFPLEIGVTAFERAGRTHYIAALHDLTDRKCAERKMEETLRLHYHREKMAAIGTLAAGLIHEIGNPVSSISSLVQEIVNTVESPAAQKATSSAELEQPLKLVLEQIDRISAITRDVSSFADLPAGTAELQDLNDLIRRTCRLLRHDQRLRSVTLDLDLDASMPALYLISDHIVQILFNLLTNAADACAPVADRSPRVTVSTRYDGGSAALIVADTGEGMSEDVLERADTPFFSTKPMGHGMGLGLSVCHSLVEAAGGDMNIVSAPRTGTQVTIHLPLAPPTHDAQGDEARALH